MLRTLDRRRFLGVSAGAAAAACLTSQRAVLAAAAASDLKVGIQMYSLRGFPVAEAMQHAHDLGFRVIEMYPGMFPISTDSSEIQATLDKMKGLELTCLAHGVNRFTKDHDKNKRMFEFAKLAGIRNLSADPDPDSFDSLDKLVEEFDVRIGIHNHGPKHRYNKVVDVLDAIKDHHKNIGACADLGHFIRSAEDPVHVIRSLQGRLFGVHLKDFAEQADKTKGVILGKGHLNVAAVFDALRQVNFPADGVIALEYEENPKDPIDEIRQCREVAIKALG
ncbi:MAG: sugar phosphate isomerase/epimerase [Planctomycetes bacterium]|nr:sugar phosphate isomerase/epimerase [Planctomycetota bacterium]